MSRVARVAASLLWSLGSFLLSVWFCLQYVEFFSMCYRVRVAMQLLVQSDDVPRVARAVPLRPRQSLRTHSGAPFLVFTDDWLACK